MVMGTIAVVGVEYDAQYQEGMTDRLKEMIEARVQAVDKSIVTVHVKDSESDYQKLMELREKLSAVVLAEYDRALAEEGGGTPAA